MQSRLTHGSDFQFIGYLVDAVYIPNGLLGHLLLKICRNHASERNTAFICLETQSSALQMRACLEGAEYPVIQCRVDHVPLPFGRSCGYFSCNRLPPTPQAALGLSS